MNAHVVKAIFKRNFLAYFSNPTGYVFICGFVLASGFAAFWPHEFFNSNLANLGQLNRYLPFIMLFFVPAITMSLWADERRQGTDELLLTLPASDGEVVAGKYLSAMAIFSASLVFSLTNLVVLELLGNPDWGLMLATYVGYWMVGVSMLAIGMVASFLTGNLTVGFVLGVAFNVPLVFAASADVIVSGSEFAQQIRAWSIMAEFQDFSRGVLSASSFVYFVAIVVVCLYLSVVLIGRRRWDTAVEGSRPAVHYAIRGVAMLVIAMALTSIFRVFDVRVDASSEGLSSLSSRTMALLHGLESKRSVTIEAFVSPEGQVPESYIQTRLNLLSTLDELSKRSGGRVVVKMHETEDFKPEATLAEQRFGITGQNVFTRDRGKFRESEVFMGVAVISGLDKVVIPFFDRGVPAEYELIRSIVSLADQQKKTLGVVTTDAKLMGGFNPHTMGQTRRAALISELEKQYEVKEVDPSKAIDTSVYDVLLLVQPSSLEQAPLDNVVAAVKSGIPTAVFEDPKPFLDTSVVGTNEPKQQQGNPMMGGSPPPTPKGDILALWQLLGVRFDGGHSLWGTYNPYPKADHFPNEFIFIGSGSGQTEPFNAKDPITSGLQQLMLLTPASVVVESGSKLSHTPLLKTGGKSGAVAISEMFMPAFFGMGGGLNPNRTVFITDQVYTPAFRIGGRPEGAEKDLNVVLVSDIDLLADPFFNLRSQGPNPDMDLHLDVDNVTFVLNAIDSLAGDDRFIDIRKRRRVHRTLKVFERITLEAVSEAKKARENFRKKFDEKIRAEEEKINKRVNEIARTPGIDQPPVQHSVGNGAISA